MSAVLKKRVLAEYSQSTTVQEQPPVKQFKKIRLAPKKVLESGSGAYIGLIEKCKNSNEVLQLLLRVSDSLHLPLFFSEEDGKSNIQKLCEVFKNQKDSVVRVKILWLLEDIGCKSKPDVIMIIIEKVMLLIKTEKSHKVLAQSLGTLHHLGKLLPDLTKVQLKFIAVAKQYLTDTNHLVKRKCLDLIGEFLPLDGPRETNSQQYLKLVKDYIHCQDARVRSAAFRTLITLHSRGTKLDPSVYSEICQSLSDDYEVVREACLKLVWLVGQTYPETILYPDTDEEIRLVDDAFGKLCNSVNDLSMRVRTQAAQLLGSMTLVGDRFLQQTLDKKLISNLRKKRSAHERAWESVQSGEWASGKKWADDAPREVIDADQVNLMNSGACGAFVHGLEDEFLEVRSASVDAICSLSLNNPVFANMSLDFLVDMFNDEIEDVRLKAIDSLTRMSQHITLREDQLETILGALEDFSVEVREGLHQMLASCRLSTKGCLQMCVESLLENLKKYPQDKKSTWRCLQMIGSKHPELTLPLVPLLLVIHPFFDTSEPDVEDPLYISILILVFNAAQHSPTMTQLFEEHTLKHYSYLRDTMPNLVPSLKACGSLTAELKPAKSSSEKFLSCILDRLETAPTTRVRTALLEAAERDLARLSEIDETVAGLANFVSLYIASQLQLAKLLSDSLCYSNNTTTLQANLVKNSIAHLLQLCLKLQYLFMGLSVEDLAAVKQLKLKTLALQLVYIVRASNLSALAPCDNFLVQVEDTQRYLIENNLVPEPFSAAVFKEMTNLEEAKPGTVARVLLPLLQASTHAPPPRPSTSVKMTTAVINQPSASGEVALKFTAGLVIGITFDAEIFCLQNPKMIRLRVKYPDQQTQLIIPKRSDLRIVPSFNSSSTLNNDEASKDQATDYRLLTTVLISHQVWTEACYVDISLVMDLSDQETGLFNTTQRVTTSIEPCIIELCKSVKVYVSPKPVKRGI